LGHVVTYMTVFLTLKNSPYSVIIIIYLCFSALSSIQDQMHSTFDISVQFFGLDWHHMFRISCNLVQLVNEMMELSREREEHFQIDMVIPRSADLIYKI
jgi:hypothetical protein